MDITIRPYEKRQPIYFSGLYSTDEIKYINYSAIIRREYNDKYYRRIKYGKGNKDYFYVRTNLKIKKHPRGGITIMGVNRIVADICETFLV